MEFTKLQFHLDGAVMAIHRLLCSNDGSLTCGPPYEFQETARLFRMNRFNSFCIISYGIVVLGMAAGIAGCGSSGMSNQKSSQSEVTAGELEKHRSQMDQLIEYDELIIQQLESIKTPADIGKVKPKLVELADLKSKFQETLDVDDVPEQVREMLNEEYGEKIKSIRERQMKSIGFFDKPEFQEAVKEIEDIPIF